MTLVNEPLRDLLHNAMLLTLCLLRSNTKHALTFQNTLLTYKVYVKAE